MKAASRWIVLISLTTAMAGVVQAKGPKTADDGSARYIVVLEQAPLAEWHVQRPDSASVLENGASAKGAGKGVRNRLDAAAPESRAYLDELERGYETFRARAEASLGRPLNPVHQYRYATNGFAASLSADEASRLAAMPGVISVQPEEIHKLHTDAGPTWIGANNIWTGFGVPQTKGEGVVVGVLDSGINWDHDSFKDLGEGTGNTADPYDHENPYPSQLGLCSKEEVLCNDKLVGVYDFVTDVDSTDTVEENTDGYDNDGHGTHVASIAVGNTDTANFTFGLTTFSGVAPNANLVTYRVCFIGDPEDSDDDGCQGSAILSAIDQAIADGVDAINYSIGSSAFSPWTPGTTPRAFLNAVNAGIFVVTSGGNSGPGAATIGSPANAPWIMAAANSSHDRLVGTLVTDFSGGEAPLPPNLVGASWVGGSPTAPIVHAADYGFPLCGAETETAVGVSCSQQNSDSNPFAPGTFNGEIVVCDRGTYGRIEKGLNLKLAGAGGYILANRQEGLQSVVLDTHCLPAAHLTADDGDILRDWLGKGSDHQARIAESQARRNSGVADVVNDSSSRGPALSPVEDVLKPNVMTPGTSILGAFAADEGEDPNQYAFLGGTSMASPHVAGGAALLLGVHPNWTPSMISSAIETTATDHLAKDESGNTATPFEAGAGRPVLFSAVEAGLYLDVSGMDYEMANPGFGGDPGMLNLPGLANSDCRDTCTFMRTVTSISGNRTWTTSASGFPEGVSVTVTPAQFDLSNGADQELAIEVDLSGGNFIGSWIYGKVTLSATGVPDQSLTMAVYGSGGELPDEWTIDASEDSGNQIFFLSNLTSLPDATITSGGLTREIEYTEALPQDPTDDDPYDGSAGTFTVLQDVPQGSLWLHAETLASTALDLDLFVGRDSNGDGLAQESEELCSSTTPQDLEVCDIFDPVPGSYWILVQNWDASDSEPDNATLVRAVVGNSGELGLTATAQGMTETNETFPVRVSWNNVDAVSGQSLVGAVGVGTDRDNPNNLGIIPVRFNRTFIKAPTTLALMDGRAQHLALRANNSHDRVFIDVPDSATSLTVSASGGDGTESDALTIELKRVGFDAAFAEAPEVPAAPEGGAIASASGANGEGPSVTVSGGSLEAGRWYVVLSNGSGAEISATVQADVEFAGGQSAVSPGLWEPESRPGINQGFDYALGAARAILWYTYDEAGLPAWYLASDLEPTGDIWVANVLRYTNDGAEQQPTVVGQVAITTLSKDDVVFTWQLFGLSGSDRMNPLASPNTCPDNGGEQSYTGIWYRGVDGLGGASVLVNAVAQGHLHYLFDAAGEPRWLLGAEGQPTPTGSDIPLVQYRGFCPNCVGSVTDEEVGVLSIDLTAENSGSWTLDYMLADPLTGDIDRTDNVLKLTQRLDCE